jgi:hypothetical protein
MFSGMAVGMIAVAVGRGVGLGVAVGGIGVGLGSKMVTCGTNVVVGASSGVFSTAGAGSLQADNRTMMAASAPDKTTFAWVWIGAGDD